MDGGDETGRVGDSVQGGWRSASRTGQVMLWSQHWSRLWLSTNSFLAYTHCPSWVGWRQGSLSPSAILPHHENYKCL